MIELVVGATAAYVVARLGWEVVSLNARVMALSSQRDSAYRTVTKTRALLDSAEEYINKLEGVSDE